MCDVLTLLSISETVDEYGDRQPVTTRRDVFAEPVSIGLKEFYQAHAVGLQPELKFKLADYLDYEGERYVEYNGQTYRVLRIYRTGQELELTLYREVSP